MITKGTQEYKRAQALAAAISFKLANCHRTSSDLAEFYQNYDEKFLDAIIALGTFASEVAKTVKASGAWMAARPVHGGYRMSDKQSWVIACAAVENNIEY